jgi:hypothetical protein
MLYSNLDVKRHVLLSCGVLTTWSDGLPKDRKLLKILGKPLEVQIL